MQIFNYNECKRAVSSEAALLPFGPETAGYLSKEKGCPV